MDILERKVYGSIPEMVKLDTVLPTARHRCDISSKEAVFFWCHFFEVRCAARKRD